MNDDIELNFTVALFFMAALLIYMGFLFVTGWFEEERERKIAAASAYAPEIDSFYTR